MTSPDMARDAFGIGATVTHQLLDQLDGPTEAGIPVLFGLQRLDQLGLHVYATQAIGLLSVARQLLGEQGWAELRRSHEEANLRALDELNRQHPPDPFIP